MYATGSRTNVILSVNTTKNVQFENIVGTTGALQTLSLNTLLRGVRGTSNSTTGGASVYGSHWFDMFTSDTDGRLWLAFNEPTVDTARYYSGSLGVGAGFTSGGQISMPNLNDEVIFEMPYYMLGHTAFQNTAPTKTGTNTGNFSYEYQIDINDENGWNGTWKTLDGATLSAETGIDPLLGFKLKLKATCTSASATNALTYIRMDTYTSAGAQVSGLYPLDVVNITLLYRRHTLPN